MSYTIAAFYQFTDFFDHAEFQAPLREAGDAGGVQGSILLAPEGVNGTIAGPVEGVSAVVGLLKRDPRFSEMVVKESRSSRPPFKRWKVRLKSEIVTMGVDVDCSNTATKVDPSEWDQLIADPEVLVIDTRNDYEVAVGSFPGAINPHTDSFSEFPAWLKNNLNPDTKIAMFCTGGIRCEKASAYMRELGFDQVYQLNGGILNYLDKVGQNDSSWEGDCYVFDKRVTVGPDLVPGDKEVCMSCNRVLGPDDRLLPGYVAGVTCNKCHGETSEDRKRRFAERQRQMDLARNRA